MSVVEVDKMASAVLTRNCSRDYFVQPIPKRFTCGDSDDQNCDKIVPICDCVVSAGNCALCILHKTKNNGRKYYHCRKPVGNHCHYFKWTDLCYLMLLFIFFVWLSIVITIYTSN
jgi:hypothetical protein